MEVFEVIWVRSSGGGEPRRSVIISNYLKRGGRREREKKKDRKREKMREGGRESPSYPSITALYNIQWRQLALQYTTQTTHV
jgi:hypothetical protein